VAALLAGSGSSPQTQPSGPLPSTPAGDVGRYFSNEEIGLGPQGWVTLHNYTSSPASLDTLFLCQPPSCVDLPDVVVEPEALARIAVGTGTGLEDVAMTGAALELAPPDGEVALYSTDDTTDRSHLWAFSVGSTRALERRLPSMPAWRRVPRADISPGAQLYRTERSLARGPTPYRRRAGPRGPPPSLRRPDQGWR
jgi:hypothetical protein